MRPLIDTTVLDVVIVIDSVMAITLTWTTQTLSSLVTLGVLDSSLLMTNFTAICTHNRPPC
jgi:hypothetical protein